MAAGPFKHFLVMDFEASCDSDEIPIANVAGCHIQSPAPHRLAPGDMVKYWTTSRNCRGGRPLIEESSSAGPVREGQEFFVRPVTPATLRLYSSALDAENDTHALSFKTGTGVGTLLQDQSTVRKVHCVSSHHHVVIPNHRMCTGNHARYYEGALGALTVRGRKLQNGLSVFVRSIDSCTLQLHSSRQDSEGGTNPIELDEDTLLQPSPSSSSSSAPGATSVPSLLVKPGIRWTPEIIEFPCVLLDAATLEVIAEFRRLVRPTENPVMPPFTTSLTSIRQEEVDNAEPLESVLRDFEAWLAAEGAEEGLPVTCGDWDLKQMLPTEATRKGLQGLVPPALHRWCNIKRPFSEALGCKPMGMDGMLKQLHIELVGHHHLGIDDARNIARLLQDLVAKHGRTIIVTGQLGHTG